MAGNESGCGEVELYHLLTLTSSLLKHCVSIQRDMRSPRYLLRILPTMQEYHYYCHVIGDDYGALTGNLIYWTLKKLVTTNNYDTLTGLHTPKITVTTAHTKSSSTSLAVAW
jgi:hypothetical protein